MIYSFPYICFVVFILLLSVVQLGFPLGDKTRKMLNAVALIAFVLFFGGRGLIGWDWVHYYTAFKEAVPIQSFGNVTKWSFKEPGFNLCMSLVKTFTSEFWIFTLVMTIVNAILLHIFFRRHLESKYYELGLAVFMIVFGFTLSTDLMRNSTGLLIFCLALPYIVTRQWYFFFPITLLGALFHWSIAPLMLCYFFLHIRFSLKIWLPVFVVANIIFLAGLPSVSLIIGSVAHFFPDEERELILGYVQNAIYGKEYGLTLGFVERTSICFLVIFYYHKLVEENKNNVLFVNAFFLFVLICLICYEFNIFITRFSPLFAFGCWIVYPKILSYLDKALRPIYWCALAFLIMIKMNNLSNNILYRYENKFTSKQITSYEKRREIFDANQKKLQH